MEITSVDSSDKPNLLPLREEDKGRPRVQVAAYSQEWHYALRASTSTMQGEGQ